MKKYVQAAINDDRQSLIDYLDEEYLASRDENKEDALVYEIMRRLGLESEDELDESDPDEGMFAQLSTDDLRYIKDALALNFEESDKSEILHKFEMADFAYGQTDYDTGYADGFKDCMKEFGIEF